MDMRASPAENDESRGPHAAAHRTRKETHPALLHIPRDRSDRTRHVVRGMPVDVAAPNDQRYRVPPKRIPTRGHIYRHRTHRNRTRHLLLLRSCAALWNAGQTGKELLGRLAVAQTNKDRSAEVAGPPHAMQPVG